METFFKEFFLQRLGKKHILISILGILLLFLYVWFSILPSVKSLALVEGDYVYTVTSNEATITEYKGGWGSVVIPEVLGGYPVVNIGENAFSDRKGLTNLTIPSSVTNIHWAAFLGCESLTRFVVDENNSSYLSLDGVLFNKDQTKLVQYPPNRYGPYEIPNTVTEIGNNAFANATRLSELIIPSGVTSIGGGAFQGCTGFTSISIPSTVTTIGEVAFFESDKLTQFIVDPDNPSFSSENGVLFNKNKTLLKKYPAGKSATSYSIPETVTDIDNYAFHNATLLTTVTIPEGVVNLGNNTFNGCTGLTTMTIPNSVVSITGGLFSGCTNLSSVTLGNGVTSIGNYAFYECRSLTSINIPDGVTSIGISAFHNNTNLVSISIPDSVTYIGDYAFYNCRNLTSVTIPEGVTTIRVGAFYNCRSLTIVTMGNSVTSIGGSAFRGCTKLNSITIPDSVNSIGDYAFFEDDGLTQFVVGNGNTKFSSEDGVLFNKNKTTLKQYPASKTTTLYVIPNTVTNIDNAAFLNAKKLNNVVIPNSVVSMGNSTFSGCSGLTSLTIPPSITSIGGGFCRDCAGLKSIIFPEGLISIGAYSFGGCTSLVSIVIPASVVTVDDGSFKDCSSLVEAHFLGNAPTVTSGLNLFKGSASGFRIYYLGGKAGWTNPWHGFRTITPISFPSSEDGVIDVDTEMLNVTNDNSIDFSAGVSESLNFEDYFGGNLAGQNLKDVNMGSGASVVTVNMDKGVKVNSSSDNLIIGNAQLSGILTGATVTITKGTTIFGPSSWNGTMISPKLGSPTSAPPGFSIGGVVFDVGSTNNTLLLDKPALITVNKRVSNLYYQLAGASSWNKINICEGTFNNPIMPDFPGECYIVGNSSDVTKVYTYHFTTYVEGVISPSYSGFIQGISEELEIEKDGETDFLEKESVKAPDDLLDIDFVEEPDTRAEDTLLTIQLSPIPPFNPEWGVWFYMNGRGGRIEWALEHRFNIYKAYIDILGRKPSAIEVNWWLQYSDNINFIRYLFLNSEEYLKGVR